ncbi:hypothetical protein SERLA73DRAFT_184344 [Serpula lacrymans var. lacrymans S7.3]|uniref:Uncharacterized protein n=1 Tax=Serpula lacrymans var. lacrymans (strain S7.3) TaxID=936435 RepID=F8Q323_SERL3|nr:hypothetical protein SERLA73DRAFT_184344 [Serpula lacrymans var. lacrymans S7.3]
MSDPRNSLSLDSTGVDPVDESTVDSEVGSSRVITGLNCEEMLATLQCPTSHPDDKTQGPILTLDYLGVDSRSESEDTVASDCFDGWDSEAHSHVSSYSSWQGEEDDDDDDEDGEEDETDEEEGEAEDEDEDGSDEEEEGEEGEEDAIELLEWNHDESLVESIRKRELWKKAEPIVRKIHQIIINKKNDSEHSTLTMDPRLDAGAKEAEQAAGHPDQECDGVIAEAGDVGQSICGIEETEGVAADPDLEHARIQEEIARVVNSAYGINIKQIVGTTIMSQDDAGNSVPIFVLCFTFSQDQGEVITPVQS